MNNDNNDENITTEDVPEIVINDDHSKSVIVRSVEDEMETKYLQYSMSVIIARALPDVRDGLKPVHRRILYSMEKNNWRPGSK